MAKVIRVFSQARQSNTDQYAGDWGKSGKNLDLAKNIFIAFCMLIVASSLGFSAWAHLPVTLFQAFTMSVALLVVQLVGYLYVWKIVVYRTMMDRINDLAVAEATNAQRLERVGLEMQKLQRDMKKVAQSEMEPLIGELEVIGTLVKQIAENSVDVDNRVSVLEETPRPVAPQRTGQVQTPTRAIHTSEPEPTSPSPTNDGSTLDLDAWKDDEDLSDDFIFQSPGPTVEHDPKIVRAVENAVTSNQVDLYLQPIVTVPQRRPKFYEALSRIKSEDGELIRAKHYIDAAEQNNAMPVLDKMLLVRAIQVLRSLMSRKSDAVVICNISASSLADSVFFNDFKRLLRAKGDLADHLIFEFSQKTVKQMGPVEEESLRALKALGFMFAMGRVNDLNVDFKKLASLGFHFVKVSLPVLQAAKKRGVNDIHVEDLSRYLIRNGIQMIIDQIETEAQVIELMNFNVGLAQGYLFGGPREVRSDIVNARPASASSGRLAS